MRRRAPVLLLMASLAPVAGGQTWTERAEVTPLDGSPNDRYGSSIALSGDTAVMGGYQDGLGYTGLAVVGLACDPARDVLYGVDAIGEQLVAVEKRRGLLRAIGPLPPRVEGLAFDLVRGVLYALQPASPDWLLLAIDPDTGATNAVGNLADPDARWMESLAHDPVADVLYAVNASDQLLLRIDPTSGAVAVVGPIGSHQWVASLAYDIDTGTLLGFESVTRDLLAFDTSTGAATVVATMAFEGVWGMAVDPVQDTLYGWNLPAGGPPPFWGGPMLIRIDPTTGRAFGAVDSSQIHRYHGAVHVEDLATGAATRLRPSDLWSGDRFGYAVGVDGDVLVAGAPRDDDGGSASGSAYVFQRDAAGQWNELAKLTAADATAGDEFGSALAIDGGTIAVGAEKHDGIAVDSGAVYLFERDAVGAWGQVAKVLPVNVNLTLFSVCDLEGDRLVVGQYAGFGSPWKKGRAYVFERDAGGPGQWGMVATLKPSPSVAGDAFGYAVTLSGDTIVVGAPSTDTQGLQSGDAFVFERDQGGPGNWGQAAAIQMNNGSAWDGFGSAVALSGDDLLVGVDGDDDNGTASGSVIVYRRAGPGSPWVEGPTLLASDGDSWDKFGATLALDGPVLLVGALQGDGPIVDTGSAYVFDLTP